MHIFVTGGASFIGSNFLNIFVPHHPQHKLISIDKLSYVANLQNHLQTSTKASSDHLMCADHRTYVLPAIITNCSNNYAPYQFPGKLILLMIINALEGKTLPVYGDGVNVHDWL